jgi:hypothetical protein
MQCPSCEKRPTNTDGVCAVCRATYIEAFGPNWALTEAGAFLLAANQETKHMNASIEFSRSVDIDRLVVTDTIEPPPTLDAVGQVIVALATVHGLGYRRIFRICAILGLHPPSLSTVRRRVAALHQQPIAERRG